MRIRNTNFDKTKKESKIPINQSIHYSCEGYRESRVKAATRVKRITTARCKARMYVMLDRQKDNWMVSKLELKHTHPCSAKQAVHYTEYRKLTIHAKCVIQNNDEMQDAGHHMNIVETWHELPFAYFVGVNHHGKSILLGCALLENEKICSFECVLKQWLQCMGTPPKAIIID
ncbi:hypothetical protein AHAS_Ahas01G0186400 [Arachis hypogaea]